MNEYQAALVSAAETALNQLLSTRPLAKERLAKLAGKRVSVVILPQLLKIEILFTQETVLLVNDSDLPADATISGQLGDLLKLVYHPQSVLFGQGVDIEGDATLVQKIQSALSDAELDWEEWLSQQLGDLPASLILKSQRSASSWASKAGKNFNLSLKDYLQDEIKLVPSRVEFEMCSNQIDKLSARTEALEKRLKRLNHNEN